MELEMYRRYSQMARGIEKAELVFKNGRVFSSGTGEFIDGDVAVADGIVIGVGTYEGETEIDLEGKVICPGFIDSHLHLESTLVTPGELVRQAAQCGTTTFIVDPHESANVSGTDGIDYILDQTEDAPANVYVMMPSCVPATHVDDNGCILTAGKMKGYLEHPRILGLGEVMDAPSVINGSVAMYEKLQLFPDRVKEDVYKRQIHNGWRQIMDLSSIPFIYKDLSEFKNRIIYYESSRGCPFSCSYCLSSIDKKLRFRDTETVKKELQFFIDNKVPQVKFVDRTFNCKHDHAMAIWKYINEHDNGVTNFHFEISADLLREEELQEMSTMRPGLIQLEIGVQSTNPDTIKAIHRTMDFEKLKGIVDRIHSFGNIHQHLDLIAGLPYEDYDSFRHSFNDVYALKPQQLQLGFLKVLKGSHMMEMCREYGIVYKTQEPYEVLSTKWLDYDHVLKLKTVENMVEVYYNSGQFQNTLEYLENFFQDAFSIYERLGSFYMEKGYGDVSHTRMRRYEILLEFLEDVPEISMDQVKDQMVYDLYLRENLKSRPGFARDQKPFERQVWDFRKREKVAKNAHVEVFADGTVLLFNYADRDPLTNNAHVTDVTKDVFENLNRD